MTGKPAVRIRAAREQDIEAIAAVHAASIREVCRAVYDAEQIAAWLSSKTRAGYLRALNEREVFVAESEGGVLGFSELELDTGEVFAVYVRPDLLRRRIGHQLLEAVEASAASRGLRLLRLHATVNAIPFYEAHGFDLVAMTTFPLGPGMSLRCARMHKALP